MEPSRETLPVSLTFLVCLLSFVVLVANICALIVICVFCDYVL